MNKLKAFLIAVLTTTLFSCTMAPAMAQTQQKQEACVHMAAHTDTMRLMLLTDSKTPNQMKSEIQALRLNKTLERVMLDNLKYAVENADTPKHIFMYNVYNNCIKMGGV